jgi:hypothetical protein
MAHQQGDQKKTTPQPTPAPVKSSAEMKSTSYGRTSYGSNAWMGRVADDPGHRTASPLAEQLKAAGDTGELDEVIKHGSRGAPDAQTRSVDVKGYPPAYGMRHRENDGLIPGAISKDQETSAPARKPGGAS